MLEEILRSAHRAALFLDVDGTLVPIAATPDAVRVDEEMLQTLFALHRALDGAIALVSGRGLDDLDRLFSPARFPAAGLHGLERRDAAGGRHDASDPAAIESLRRPLADFASQNPGVLIEDKGGTIALHYRQAPAAMEAARDLVQALVEPFRESLVVLPGKMIFEIKPAVADKGVAIASFLREPPYAGRRPLFIGDDVTDEDGFKLVNERGGVSILVGEGPGEGRQSAAKAHLADVAAVDAWLLSLLKAAQDGAEGSGGQSA